MFLSLAAKLAYSSKQALPKVLYKLQQRSFSKNNINKLKIIMKVFSDD